MAKKPKPKLAARTISRKKTSPPKVDAGLSTDSSVLSPKLKAKSLNAPVSRALLNLGSAATVLPRSVSVSALGESPTESSDGEPVYGPQQRQNIQGNVVPGFNKDHQSFLFYRLGKLPSARAWLRWITPQISSLEEVLAFVRAHRALRLREGVSEPALCSTWINIAFSHGAIQRLAGKADAAAFGDASFRQGLAARSTYLGDPTNPRHSGHRSKWRVGGPDKEADLVVIVAADEPEHLQRTTTAIKRRALADGLTLLYEQRCANLPGSLAGHEHFGFKDGISQPGVRGKVSAAPGDYITPRYLAPSNPSDPSDNRAQLFAKPGQLLIWPGEFLLGEPRQDPNDLTSAGDRSSKFPSWAALGSYLVCRRLRQDVQGFWRFAAAASAALGLSAEQVASMFVGRWPSGAPLMRTPSSDDAALAGDPWANNHFIYEDDARPSNLTPIPGYGGDNGPQAKADVLGNICPHFAHIRKVNPRDMGTDLGKPADTMMRMILRRGVPYGPPLIGVKRPSPALVKQDRGLMFVCYGATIEDQFEFLSRRWVNSAIHPNIGGHEPVIGQANQYGNRERYIDFPTTMGARRIRLEGEWVTPTGGGYFFAPPIDAISGVLGA